MTCPECGRSVTAGMCACGYAPPRDARQIAAAKLNRCAQCGIGWSPGVTECPKCRIPLAVQNTPDPAVATAGYPVRPLGAALRDGPSPGRPGMSRLALLLSAAAVFGFCSLVQMAAGSSMFSNSYRRPDSMLLELAVNITYYPGWLAIIGLVLAAVRARK